MNKAIAKKWCKALESGRYEQTTGQLKDVEGYCCLGVLCELAIKAGVQSTFRGDKGVLPDTIRRWAGMATHDGTFSYSNSYSKDDLTLTILNDDGHSFKRIAKIIRSNVDIL